MDAYPDSAVVILHMLSISNTPFQYLTGIAIDYVQTNNRYLRLNWIVLSDKSSAGMSPGCSTGRDVTTVKSLIAAMQLITG